MIKDQLLTMEDIATKLQDLFITILGLGPMRDAWATSDHTAQEQNPYYYVRVSWPIEGSPAFTIDDDFCFIRMFESDDAYNRQREKVVEDIDADTIQESLIYTRVVEAQVTFYGPKSFTNAHAVRDAMLTDAYRNVLAVDKIYPIPDIPAAQQVPENFQGRWWKRVDLSLRFNVLTVRTVRVNTIKSVQLTTSSDTILSSVTITSN